MNAKSDNPPTIAQHLCFKLYSASLLMTQLYKPILSALNLTYPQYLVMVILWDEEGLGLKELADRLGQDSGSLTPVVKRLEEVGYLVRKRHPDDVRSLMLLLTDAGKALRKEGLQVSRQIVQQCGINAGDAGNLMAGLDALIGNLRHEVTPSL
ncbi:MarR family winged helix-turn-helix transcriptional regulator [Rugamonas rivuli]|uniref:MarR family transcriptional regulator n=1 Tax=Rugamonas rivuli TaxID=2743358 RepID=A0A843SJ85_9BURK|nr:MarR family transcriptional regulator [Rugamonas rivuli]MQA20436.1 MarR family transcriptional regulator [Rugamonas rivuli]